MKLCTFFSDLSHWQSLGRVQLLMVPMSCWLTAEGSVEQCRGVVNDAPGRDERAGASARRHDLARPP